MTFWIKPRAIPPKGLNLCCHSLFQRGIHMTLSRRDFLLAAGITAAFGSKVLSDILDQDLVTGAGGEVIYENDFKTVVFRRDPSWQDRQVLGSIQGLYASNNLLWFYASNPDFIWFPVPITPENSLPKKMPVHNVDGLIVAQEDEWVRAQDGPIEEKMQNMAFELGTKLRTLERDPHTFYILSIPRDVYMELLMNDPLYLGLYDTQNIPAAKLPKGSIQPDLQIRA
jgi:hypothetical protein